MKKRLMDDAKKNYQTPEFASLRKDTNIKLKWDNLDFRVKQKRILTDCNGSAKTGDLYAVMGPSGAGKSTLLNALAGRIKNSGKAQLNGAITVNGVDVEKTNFHENLAYVMQEDALTATATPREALHFSALLRLPASVNEEEREQRVNDLIISLGLSKCADTRIGNVLIKGISGGEKKRTAIGVELITHPDVMFLDEPTTGLDSYAAYNVIRMLKQLAAAGCCVLCTIHQPSSEVFYEFTNIILVSEGQTVYNGAREDVASYFDRVYGAPCGDDYNPADHVMFVMEKRSPAELVRRRAQHAKLQEPEQHDKSLIKRESTRFSETNFHIVRRGCCTQMYALMLREFRNLGRDKAGLGARFGMTAFLNILVAVIFYQVGNQSLDTYDINSHFGALTQLVIGTMFGSAQPMILTFPQERPIFLREYGTGTYGIVSYFISKIIVEIPMAFLMTAEAFLITYWLVGFNGNLLYLILINFVLSLVASSTALIIGSLATTVQAAMQLTPLIFVPQLLFIGFFIRIELIPIPLRYLQYIAPLKYAINLNLLAEFDKDNEQANQLLKANEIERDQWYVYLAILGALFVVFRLISILALRAKAVSLQ